MIWIGFVGAHPERMEVDKLLARFREEVFGR